MTPFAFQYLHAEEFMTGNTNVAKLAEQMTNFCKQSIELPAASSLLVVVTALTIMTEYDDGSDKGKWWWVYG